MRLVRETLGYDRFFAHGGDVGSGVTTRLAILYPEFVSAIHLLAVADPALESGSRELTENEQVYLAQPESMVGGGRSILASAANTPPNFILRSYGFTGWFGFVDCRKGSGVSDCGGDIESRFTKDDLLTNIMLYWVTEPSGRRCGCTMRIGGRRHGS
ncbi:unnamed protein product [Sphagnum balticum]